MHRSLRPLLLGSLALAGAIPAHATSFCIDSSQGLASALQWAHTEAIASAGASVMELRLERSTVPYEIGAWPVSNSFPFGGLKIKGGYSDDCASRVIAADNTLIHLNNSADVRHAGDLLLEGVTIDSRDIPYLTFGYEGAGENAIAIVRSTRSRGSALEIGNVSDKQFKIEVTNSIFQDAEDIPNVTTCGLTLSTLYYDKASAVVRNSTFSLNDSGLCVSKLSAMHLRDSIVWGNTFRGIYDYNSSNTAVSLSYNVLQSTNLFKLSGPDLGTVSQDPLFLDDDLRISQSSPAVNSSSPDTSPQSLPSRDVYGNDRDVGTVDRGAHETSNIDTGLIVVTLEGDPADVPAAEMTLRKAIGQANVDPGADTIVFDIGQPSKCPAIITLTNALPQIIDDLTIDGLSQPGSSPNSSETDFNASHCVRLTTFNGVPHAFEVPTGEKARLVVKGLDFSGFTTAVALRDGSGHRITSSRFRDPGASIHVLVTPPADEAQIGGYDLASANSFTINTEGIRAASLRSESNRFLGNRVLGGESGVLVLDSGNEIAANYFMYIDGPAVQVNGNSNEIRYNVIDRNMIGIEIDQFYQIDGTGNDNVIEDNFILGNGTGVVVQPKTQRNRIVNNTIKGNDWLGIDLDGDGQVNPNVPGGFFATDNANGGQHYPVLTGAHAVDGSPQKAVVHGTLSARNGSYTIQLFANQLCHAQGHGEGGELIGTVQVQISDADGTSEYNQPFSATVASVQALAGDAITATATSQTNNTSEFSACVSVLLGLPAGVFSDGFEDQP